MNEYDAAELTGRENARIIKTAVTPRPIAWISTRNEDGVDNLAPYSSYNMVSSVNPVVMFNSPNADNGGLKDSAKNALDTGEFAVNVVTESQIEVMDLTSKDTPPDESEFELADIERAECQTIDAARVADSVVTMECTLYDSLEIHDRIMILGEVQYYHVNDSVVRDGKVDSRHMPTVGRLGGPYYTVSDPDEFERQF